MGLRPKAYLKTDIIIMKFSNSRIVFKLSQTK